MTYQPHGAPEAIGGCIGSLLGFAIKLGFAVLVVHTVWGWLQ